MTEIESLQHIGLNKYEAEAYLTLLSQGPLTGYELGKRSPVPLSRSYEILERLTQKGLALAQPGDPPHYTATDPQLFLGRVRANMTETLDSLAATLSALPRANTSDQFWIIRGRQNILERAQSMLTATQHTLALHLPARSSIDLLNLQAVAQSRSQHLEHIHISHTDPWEPQILLLLIDSQEALASTLTPAEHCQAVVSANPALIALLNRYFSQQPAAEQTTRPAEHQDWLDWEERKQRRLHSVYARNHIA